MRQQCYHRNNGNNSEMEFSSHRSLLSHSTPLLFLDKTERLMNVGCEDLYKRVFDIKPKIHLFGHIHYSYGVDNNSGVCYSNGAICGENYLPINKERIIELHKTS